jgi:predicted lipid-binding transport protein (Tim44 family)
MLDIIIFAVITAFIISRLFKALGDTQYDREDREEGEMNRPLFEDMMDDEDSLDTKKELLQQIDIASAMEAALPPAQREVFESLRKYNPTFTADEFVDGAKKAFEMILVAFSKHDKTTLEHLLSSDVYKDFASEIDKRIKAKEKHETTIVAIESTEIVDAEIEKNTAYLSVKIKSEQIHVVKDLEKGDVKSGNASKIKIIEDVWTFSKNIKSKDKIWLLESTDAAN